VLSSAELTGLAIGSKPTGSGLDVVEDLKLIERVPYVFCVILVLFTDFRVLEEVFEFSFENTFFTVVWVVSVELERSGRRLDNWPKQLEYPLLDLSRCAIGVEEDDP